MKKNGMNIWKIFAIVMILAICLSFNNCISFQPIDEALARVINPGPDITMNPIAWIKDGRIEDRDRNEIHVAEGIVVNEAFMLWVRDMKVELDKFLKGRK